ncbi:MAG TPA: MFS transporter, partial [Ornithinibacter sp.]|nr:MFS transporter [Ornithinibacter sp.]
RKPNFTAGISAQMLQQVALGGAMIVLPLFLQMTLEYNAMEAGLSLAPLSLTMFAVAVIAGKRAGNRRPAAIIRAGFLLAAVGITLIIPIVPRVDSGWYLVVPLVITGGGLGMLVSQLNNYALAPIEEERISEAAGVNSAAGSFGLSFGLAMAGGLMLAALSLSFTNLTESSDVIPPAQQQQIATALQEDAEVMSNTALAEQITGQPAEVEAEVVAINDTARNRSLQVALLVPLLATLLGVVNSFRMLRLPDVKSSTSLEGLDLG